MANDGWKTAKLGELVLIPPPRPNGLSSDEDVTFLSMSDLGENGEILRRQTRPYAHVAKGFTSFGENDVIVPRITPCFENCKGALATQLVRGVGFGSTEFHVLRATDQVDARFIYYITMSDDFRRRGALEMTVSAGQKRVPSLFLKQYSMALPPLREQEKIADLLVCWGLQSLFCPRHWLPSFGSSKDSCSNS